MDPSPLKRRVLSKLMTHVHSESQVYKRRVKAEKARRKDGRPHVVDYFHQVEDGYSHLACQLLERLANRYDIELRCHLVRGPEGNNAPDAALLLRLAHYDAALIAGEYGLVFPTTSEAPTEANVTRAQAILTSASKDKLYRLLPQIGQALWRNDETELASLATQYGEATASEVDALLCAGTTLRSQLSTTLARCFITRVSGIGVWIVCTISNPDLLIWRQTLRRISHLSRLVRKYQWRVLKQHLS